MILLYDVRRFEQNPFLTINLDDTAALSQVSMPPRVPVITSIRFNQTGQYILVGTAGDVHYVADSFSGQVVFRLVGHVGLERADGAAIGMIPQAGASGHELCWAPDGNMVIAGSANGQLCVWSLPAPGASPVTLQPSSVLNGHEGTPRVVAFNPRYARAYELTRTHYRWRPGGVLATRIWRFGRVSTWSTLITGPELPRIR